MVEHEGDFGTVVLLHLVFCSSQPGQQRIMLFSEGPAASLHRQGEAKMMRRSLGIARTTACCLGEGLLFQGGN